jgi:hypothetical protein
VRQTATLAAAFRAAAPIPIPRPLVKQCLRPDDRFRQAWPAGIDQLDVRDRRGRLCVETGTIAESVATLLLLEAGLEVFSELATAGVHGVDLLALSPAEQVLALEVKGTLRERSRPRLGRAAIRQMSLAWLDSDANPAMLDWGLAGLDLYGGIAHLNFASMTWRAVLSGDFETWVPAADVGDLLDLSFLKPQPPHS